MPAAQVNIKYSAYIIIPCKIVSHVLLASIDFLNGFLQGLLNNLFYLNKPSLFQEWLMVGMLSQVYKIQEVAVSN